ncbi:2-amino-4-hydroxy-6-hydroxymethyldihydropteridine diphosphokinase [Thiovibrio sp. JS02]
MPQAQQVFIGLGSNLGDGRRNLLAAWRRLGEIAGVETLRLSSPYRTEPVRMVTTHWFTNAVGELRTGLAPEALLAAMLRIEAEFGRDRSKTADRPLDLDLLYYGDLVLHGGSLTLPHPELANRLFVLAPLAELAPGHVHPLLGLTTRQLLETLRNSEAVERQEWHVCGETS